VVRLHPTTRRGKEKRNVLAQPSNAESVESPTATALRVEARAASDCCSSMRLSFRKEYRVRMRSELSPT